MIGISGRGKGAADGAGLACARRASGTGRQAIGSCTPTVVLLTLVKALVWHGKRDVRVEEVPDPTIQEPTDAIIKVTSTAICGSDLHLYEVLAPTSRPGTSSATSQWGSSRRSARGDNIKPGDRVVIPFNISCGHCWMCERNLHAQCETTQQREQGKGAASSGTRASTVACPGVRRSTSACRRRSSARSRCRRARRTAFHLPV